MTTIEIIGGTAATIGLGAYLRRGTMPVVLAYRIGRDVERGREPRSVRRGSEDRVQQRPS